MIDDVDERVGYPADVAAWIILDEVKLERTVVSRQDVEALAAPPQRDVAETQNA